MNKWRLSWDWRPGFPPVLTLVFRWSDERETDSPTRLVWAQPSRFSSEGHMLGSVRGFPYPVADGRSWFVHCPTG